jgi:hypothetical protein
VRELLAVRASTPCLGTSWAGAVPQVVDERVGVVGVTLWK